jgi:ABC-2 type transport system ATP-binding protein
MDQRPIIRTTNLTKIFKVLKRRSGFLGGLRTLFSRNYQHIRALDGVSFSLAEGEIVGYLGPNGAGKSTTVKILSGVLHPTGGEAVVNGLVPYRQRKLNGKNIGVLFGQRSQLIWDLPPRDTFELLKRIYAVPSGLYRANLERFTELLSLEEILDQPVRQLSLGQRMRCELVATLLHNPKVVYLDEPTIGLDIVAKGRIREFIKELNRELKTTVLLTTHDLSDIEKLCPRVVIIDKGRIIHDGALSEIKRKYGRRRRLVFLPLIPRDADTLEEEVGKLDREIETSLRQDGSIVITFDPQRIPASDLTRRIINNYEIKDLSLEEADIEVIVREIYERGSVS